MTAIDKLIAVAEAEIGYLEKKSNSNLDDKTANAGSNNYTKYNRDMKAWAGSAGLNDQWCQNFVDWCFVTAFGLDAAKKLIYTFTNYTPTGSNAFKKKSRYIKRGSGTPKRGDVIYFYSSAKGRIGHVGIIYKVSGSTVYTIEGNTSGASSLVTNGGGVRKKSYKMTSTYIDGYGSVDYAAISNDVDSTQTVLKLGDRVLKNGCEGADVMELQTDLIELGYDCGKWGIDGEFGDATEMAVKAFQTDCKLTADGEFGSQSYAAMLVALAKLEQPLSNPRKVEIFGGNCYIRTAPNTSGMILGVARSGEKHEYGGQTSDDGWHLIAYNNQNAWVSGKYSRLMEG